MVKERLVVVVNSRLPKRDRLCSVVPLSTTPACSGVTYQVKIDIGQSPPEPFPGQIKWAKADMMSVVSYDRLNLPYDGRCIKTGRRKYVQIRMPLDQMKLIREAILVSLDLAYLIPALK